MMRLVVALAFLIPNSDYLPLKAGLNVTYQVEDVGAEAAASPTDVVARVASSEDEWLEVSNYLGYRHCWLRGSEAGIDLKLEARADAPVITILKPSAKVGETWTGSFGRETLTFTLRGEERIERGDTRVQALHVEFTAAAEKHQGHQPTRGDVWFAAGLGVVKAQVTTDLDCHTATSKVYTLKP
jgi:hypothetical protein